MPATAWLKSKLSDLLNLREKSISTVVQMVEYTATDPTLADGESANLRGNNRGHAKVEVTATALPTGAATEATLADIKTRILASLAAAGTATEATLAGIKALLPTALGANGGLKVEGVAGGVAQPVSAAALPLPAGAATETTLAAQAGAQRNSTAPNLTTSTAVRPELARDGSLRVNADLYQWPRQTHLVASTAGQLVTLVRTPPTYPFDGVRVGTDDVVVYGQPRGQPYHVVDGMTFTDPTKWAGSGADWAVAGGKATHSVAGGGDDLVATIDSSWPFKVGLYYLVYLDVTVRAGTSLTAYLGTTAGTAITATGTYGQILQCATSSAFKITATTDCDADVNKILVVPCTPTLTKKMYEAFAMTEILAAAAAATPSTMIVATGIEVFGCYRRVPGATDLG